MSQQGDGLRAMYRVLENGKWPSPLRFAKTNYLELLAVFIALKHFRPFLHRCHILISSDRSTKTPHVAREMVGCSSSLRSAQTSTKPAEGNFDTVFISLPRLPSQRLTVIEFTILCSCCGLCLVHRTLRGSLGKPPPNLQQTRV